MKNKKLGISIVILIIVEQLIKIIINNNFLNMKIGIIPPFVYFEPMFNRHYSWINSLFDLGFGRIFHIVLVLFILSFVYSVYKYIKSIIGESKLLDLSYVFIMAGAICSLIDKVFWNGSLDYIYLRGLFTFDLKDVYISLYVVLIIYGMIFKKESLEKIDEENLVKNYILFLKSKKAN